MVFFGYSHVQRAGEKPLWPRFPLPLVADALSGGNHLGASCRSLFFFGSRPRARIGALWIAGAAAISMQLIFTICFAADRKAKGLVLLLFPAGVLLITAMMLRAGYRCVKNGGIDWRGTHYPLEQLRAGQRVKF